MLCFVCILTVKKAAAVSQEKGADVESPTFMELLQGQNVSDGDAVTLQCRIAGKFTRFLVF